MASSFWPSRTWMRSWIEASASSCSFFRARNLSRCSEKLTNWSSAFWLTLLYVLSFFWHACSCVYSDLSGVFWYCRYVLGIEPRSRILAIVSSSRFCSADRLPSSWSASAVACHHQIKKPTSCVPLLAAKALPRHRWRDGWMDNKNKTESHTRTRRAASRRRWLLPRCSSSSAASSASRASRRASAAPSSCRHYRPVITRLPPYNCKNQGVPGRGFWWRRGWRRRGWPRRAWPSAPRAGPPATGARFSAPR
jgi:hypothetical protein